MKDKIIHKATEMFLKLGFKSVTMDDIACEMCISKKTIYKYFCNKELLIQEGNEYFNTQINAEVDKIIGSSSNAIEENFTIRKMFANMFKVAETSPLYQLKKHYPDIHKQVMEHQTDLCTTCFRQNIIKGIEQGFYRNNIDVESHIKFYYTIIFNINDNTPSEKETQKLELEALEYHTRAMATPKGIAELEKQLLNYSL
ncbi:MAG: TetR/AcrR family transcriptional regulator [Flavobacterium sp.]|nr:TetR/AcrR family transcriptional regulator [Flavobacterium sp.]